MENWIHRQTDIKLQRALDERRRVSPQEWAKNDTPEVAKTAVPWDKILQGKNLRVLELGSKNGELSAYLSRFDAVGKIDSVEERDDRIAESLSKSIKKYQGKAEKINPIRGFLSPLPGPDGAYDVVVTNGSARFSENLLQLLRDIRRALKPGGTLVILNEISLSNDAWISAAQQLLSDMTQRISKGEFREREGGVFAHGMLVNPYTNEHVYSECQWTKAPELAGFECEQKIALAEVDQSYLATGPLTNFLCKRRAKITPPVGWLSDADQAILTAVAPYTMTPPERVLCLIQAVEYVHEKRLEGDFVECGVWRGGSIMTAALTFMRCGDTSRKIYLYDTFDGMSEPTEIDTDEAGIPAATHLKQQPKDNKNHYWAYATLEDVKRNVYSTNYPQERFEFIKGKVEETIPGVVPEKISILRLDTDWFESTKHELDYLYPRLVSGGILILDDYGFWKGARKAVDEWLAKQSPKMELHKIDEIARYCIKP